MTTGNRGAERLKAAFARALEDGSRALIPYITAGDPDLDATVSITHALVRGGADAVEWGIPFSDPLADGPTIQRAAQRALAAGTTARRVLDAVRRLRMEGCQVPLALMVYANTVWRYTPERFVADAAAAGVDGIIIPDWPLEEATRLLPVCRREQVALVPLVAPTSPAERIARITAAGDGFVYCVSVTGVTGARERLASNLGSFLERVRAQTSLPLAVGFGIATPEHAREAAAWADGVIVGSALIQHLEDAPTPAAREERATAFMAAMKEALAAAGTRR